MTDNHSLPSQTETGAGPLAQEIQKNLLIQEAINAILRISLEPICLDEQVGRVLELILQLPWLSLERKGGIYLADEEAKLLILKAQVGMPAAVLSSCGQVPFGTCLCGRAIAANEIVFANCVDACHTILYPGIQPHGHYCVPISSGGRRVGLLNLYVRQGHPSSADEVRFLQAVADVLAGVIERQRAQERLQEQLRLAALGRDVGLALNQRDSLRDMLRECAEAIVRHLDAAFARIWTLNEADNMLELQASAGLYTHIDGGHRRVPVGLYKIGLIALQRKPHLTNDVRNDLRVHDQEWARREGLVAFAGYPLLVEDRLVGVMAMFARHPLSEATLQAMSSIANGMALGIERKQTQERLLEQLIQRKKIERRLAAEHAVSQILAMSSSLREAAPEILRAICESLDWDLGIFWAVDRKANMLRLVEVWHRPTLEARDFVEDSRQRSYAPGLGLPGRVWAQETSCWVPDLAAETDFPRASIAADAGLHGAVGFPVRNGAEFQGVMEFFSRAIRQTDDELIQMMTSIGRQISQFIERRETESELRRQEADRRIAQEAQQAILPKVMPTFAGFQISGRSVPAQDVGGDCFDFLPLPAAGQGSLGVLVADASGHGLGAALLVAQTRAYLRALALACTEVGTLLTHCNQLLANALASDHFVTVFLLRLDPRTRVLAYANAGHWAGYVLDRQGLTKAVLASTGCPLGIDLAGAFPAGPSTTLEPGELALLFTDGIVEAACASGQLFGLERTLDIVRAHQQQTPDAILDALFHAVGSFSGQQLQDDITAVLIKAEELA